MGAVVDDVFVIVAAAGVRGESAEVPVRPEVLRVFNMCNRRRLFCRTPQGKEDWRDLIFVQMSGPSVPDPSPSATHV